MAAKKQKSSSSRSKSTKAIKGLLPRRVVRYLAIVGFVFAVVMSIIGDWFVHHSREWLAEKEATWPSFIVGPLNYFGDRAGDTTDALGWTGTDVVYSFDEAAPTGSVFYAGAPVRVSAPAPSDIQVLDRGDFVVGWSPSLKHPVWVAYHVPQYADYDIHTRPSTFKKDPSVPSTPASSAYTGSNYDRGHMAPNHAIATRFGEDAQKRTFLTSNISPQTPNLNRGPWRNVELRIADYWAKHYGEIWVIVGAHSPQGVTREQIPGTGIDVPAGFYQIIVAQNNEEVRAMAVYMPQQISSTAFPTRYLVSIDELETLTGLDFFPEMPDFIQKPLEAQIPTRMWPVGFLDAIGLFFERFHSF